MLKYIFGLLLVASTAFGVVDGTLGANTFILREASPGANKIYLTAPSFSTDYTLTFPTTAGTSNQVLTTNGSGTLSWTTPSVGSSGDVTGPATSVSGEATVFNDTTGKKIARATGTGFAKLTSGVLSAQTSINVSTDTTGVANVANGGTGKATLTANALLLGNGTNPLGSVSGLVSGDVATFNGTTWVSQAVSGGTGTAANYAYYSGYHDNTCNGWSRTSNTMGDLSADATCNLVQRKASGISAATTGSVIPALVLTLPRTGAYVVCASGSMYEDASAGGAFGLFDGTNIMTEASTNALASSNGMTRMLCGLLDATSTTMTVKLQCRSNGSTCRLSTNATSTLEWIVHSVPGNAG